MKVLDNVITHNIGAHKTTDPTPGEASLSNLHKAMMIMVQPFTVESRSNSEGFSDGGPSTQSIDSSHLNLNLNMSAPLYTMVLFLTGQQASGLQALINLQCRAHSLELPVVILEPVIASNKLKAMPPLNFTEAGYPILDQPLPVMKFSQVFDIDNFNEASKNFSYPQLVPRDHFFESAPRRIVFVVIYEGRSNELPEMRQLWPRRNALYESCFDPLTSKLVNDSRFQLYQLTQEGFCVVKLVQFRMARGEELIFTENQFRKRILGGQSYSTFTLVFNRWMPKFVMPGSKGRECIHIGYHSTKGQILPSKRVLADAEYYQEHYLKSSGKHLTLMIRLEHVYTFLHRPRSQYGNWTVPKCLNASVSKAKELKRNISLGRPFVTLDIGRFGSTTANISGAMKSGAEDVIKYLLYLYDGKWDLAEWENSFIDATGGIEDSSYIATLQRTLASKSECLILVGGGKFQELTMRNYMKTHNREDWCIHLYCIEDRGSYAI